MRLPFAFVLLSSSVFAQQLAATTHCNLAALHQIMKMTEDRPIYALAGQPVLLLQSSAAGVYTMPIEGIYLHLKYSVGVGGGRYPTYKPYLFLSDGSVTSDLSYYPTSAQDVERWRQEKPKLWGHWTKHGNTISIQWNDPSQKTESWDKWYVARPGTPGMALSGNYRSIGGGGNTALGGRSMVVVWSNYRFSPDGTVTSEGGSGSTYSGSPSVATSSNPAAQTERYRIDQYYMDLQHSNGSKERAWFFRFPDSDDVIGVKDKILSRK